jgi:hypothetical protein
MSFWNELWEDMKDFMREVGRKAWEETKASTKEEAKRFWEESKEFVQREWRRQSAPVPADVAQVLEATPESETPVIPYRTDTAPFLDRVLEDSDFERGWAIGKVKERPVRIHLPSKEAVFHIAAGNLLQEHEEKFELQRKYAEVPQDVLDLINNTPPNEEPVVRHREELGIYVDPGQDLDQVLKRGYLSGTVRGRRVRLDIRHFNSELRELKKVQDELKQFYKRGE